jgi:hypothetical protein
LLESLLAAARKTAQLERKVIELERAARASRGGTVVPDPVAINSARLREIEGWMGSRPGSADYKKYWRDDKVQAEYKELTAKGAKADATPPTADADVDRRIAEIESMMGTRKYTEPVQAELRELYDRRGQLRRK